MAIARKVLFYLFLLTYFVLCPLLIFQSFGYVLYPAKKRISQTGLIRVETAPEGADIYLENSRYTYKTPASITELLPGTYRVMLRLKGYRSWSHEVLIQEGKASVFTNVLLVPKTVRPQVLIPRSDFENIIAPAGPDSVILKKGPQLADFFIFNGETGKLEPLLKESAYFNFPVSDIFSVIGSKRIIVFGGALRNKGYYVMDVGRAQRSLTDITSLFDGKPDELIWSAAHQDIIFAVYGDHIDRLDLKEMSVLPRFIEDVKGVGVAGKWLYVLAKDNSITRMTIDTAHLEPVFEDAYFSEGLFSESRFYSIQVLADERLLFSGSRGDVITAVPNYDSVRRSEKDALLPDPVTVQTVYERGNAIAQCFWVYNGSHILVREKDRVFLLEVFADGKHTIEHIVFVKNNSDIFYSEKTGYLYYFDQLGNLARLTIVPEEFLLRVLQRMGE
jgi:hypothetical protein